jgi:hypothetical protein
MGFIAPTPTPYEPLSWSKKPLVERGRMVCEAWALQGYGTPYGVFGVYALKIAFFVGVWFAACSLSPPLGGPSTFLDWWMQPIAFEKAIVWSLLFEVLGLGCGSGPLTGRYFPPVGGFLYFLRPGTTKLPLFPGTPVIGARTRGGLDVALYGLLLLSCGWALVQPYPGFVALAPIVMLVPLLGVLDKTIFLAARAEHYWVTLVCIAFARDWVAAAMAVQLAVWFWAGFSKLNHHFPTVVAVMTSNGPLTRFAWLRKLMYVDFPRDLRPSGVATWLAHLGTLLEVGVPVAFLLTPLGTPPVVAVLLMLGLHGYITSNVPMGVPLEWNVTVVYSGFALFWAHPDVSTLTAQSPGLMAFMAVMLLAVPLLGNLFPERISFLLSMRYYAGNWANSTWLFKGDAYRKLDKLTKSSAWVHDQLARFYDPATAVGLVGKVIAFRLMHLHGRALPALVKKAVDRLDDYEWVDGELVAGMALGWNFGEGHLHQEQLLESLQAQCQFEEGELRCIFLESQPLGRQSIGYRVVDAKTGLLYQGRVHIESLRSHQPWETGATG